MPHILLQGDQMREPAGALQVSLRMSYTWIGHIIILCPISYVLHSTLPTVCDWPSRPSGHSRPALLALLLVIPCKSSSCVSLWLAADFHYTRLSPRWPKCTNGYSPAFPTLSQHQATTVLTKSHCSMVVGMSCLLCLLVIWLK
jgi:hypothetical protein